MGRKQILKLAVTALSIGVASTVMAGSISGKVTLKGLRSNADAVVYIEKIEGKTFPPPKEPVVMVQRGMVFLPKILPVVVGTTVEFLNSDAVAHNVFTPDECADKDSSTSGTGRPTSRGRIRSANRVPRSCSANLIPE